MTAHAMAGDRERCLAAGMDGYIAKPITARELIELLEKSGKNKPGLILVPRGGLEPPRPCGLRILSPLRLPISPSGHCRVGSW